MSAVDISDGPCMDAKTPKLGQIEEVFQGLMKKITDVEKQMESLRERLSAVLRTPNPESQRTAPEDNPDQCLLASALATQADRVYSIDRALDSLIDRIEL